LCCQYSITHVLSTVFLIFPFHYVGTPLSCLLCEMFPINPKCTSHLSCMSVLMVGMVFQLESVSPQFMSVMPQCVLNIWVRVLWFTNDTTVSKVTSHIDFTTDPMEHETQSVLLLLLPSPPLIFQHFLLISSSSSPPPPPHIFIFISSSSLRLHLLLLLISSSSSPPPPPPPQCCQHLSLYRYVLHKNVSVNDGPQIRRSHNILIL